MSLLGFDGFSRYRQVSELSQSNWVVEVNTGNLQIDTDGGQNERGALSFGAKDRSQTRLYWNIGTSKQDLCMGFWFTYDGFDTGGGDIYDNIMSFQSTTSVRNTLRLYQDGHLRLQRSTNSTELWDSSDPLLVPDGVPRYLYPGIEYKIEIKASWINATGSFELRVNDDVWARYEENIDLDGTINRIYFQNNYTGSGSQFSISDWYIVDTSDATGIIDFLGSSFQVEVLRPTGDSATEADFSPSTGVNNYAMVDEAPRHDADATYVNSSVDTDIDRYTTTTTLSGLRSVGINVIAVARHEGSADNFRLTIFENATAGNGSTEALTGDYIPYHYFRTTNPDTGAEWTPTELEGSEFGVENLA
jgi:hypothetical protein